MLFLFNIGMTYHVHITTQMLEEQSELRKRIRVLERLSKRTQSIDNTPVADHSQYKEIIYGGLSLNALFIWRSRGLVRLYAFPEKACGQS
jgi:hypothetical protein